MAIPWDPSLPDYFIVDGFSGEPPNNTVWNESLSGQLRSQLISTHKSEPITGAMILNLAELAVFKGWYADPTKCNNGNEPFQDLNDPFTATNVVWKFMGKPSWSPYQNSGTHFVLSLPLLKLPDAPV